MAVDPLNIPTAPTDDARNWIRTWVRQFFAPLERWRRSDDPFSQYTLETDALALFSFAAYGRMNMSASTAFPNLGAGWQTLTVFDTVPLTPRGMLFDTTADTVTIDYDGVYRVSISGSFGHNSSNSGRTTRIRLYDVTAGAAGLEFPIGIGRNVEDTVIPVSAIVEITEAQKGHAFRIEIGGGDTVSAVEFNVMSFDINAVSEWREPLPSDPGIGGPGALLTGEGGETLTDEGGGALTT